ncbi:flagellar protein FlaG [Pseudomonas sp. C11]|uniref:flagellar protein FlaG n=1 Tax=Pseudomonas sp. C11 TaxID=3075550 RepID=UPI002AFF3927|nr:flagellar protein FlaG [Pseudomonas sp. C11]
MNVSTVSAVPVATPVSSVSSSNATATYSRVVESGSTSQADNQVASNASSGDSESQRAEVDSAVASMQSFVQAIKRDLNFHIDDSSGRVVVKVLDGGSGDVVRQIPSEEALQLAARLEEARSLLFSEQA